MVRNGVSVPSVMGLARWDNACVLRYLKAASMANITNEYRGGVKMRKATEVAGQTQAIKRFNDGALKKLAALEADVKKSEEDFDKLARELKIVSSRASPAYILSSKGKFHVSFPWQDRLPKQWTTKCSWKCGNVPLIASARFLIRRPLRICASLASMSRTRTTLTNQPRSEQSRTPASLY